MSAGAVPPEEPVPPAGAPVPAAAAARLFGTDGVRGRFGEPPLDRETVSALARELAAMLAGEGRGEAPPRVVLGGDTRTSSPVICRWLASSLAAGGAAVRYAGVIPTPGIACLARALRAAAGIAVSASHNPSPDNGIKLLDGEGYKWSEACEGALERRLRLRQAGAADATAAQAAAADAAAGGAGSGAGKRAAPPGGEGEPPGLAAEEELRQLYLGHLLGSVPAAGNGAPALAGLRLVFDAGNGAASGYAGELFGRLGAELTLLGAEPDGDNINRDCGSTAPAKMAAATRQLGADLGAAFDGDADRCVLADERGAVHDGDAILYLWALALAREGKLQPPRIVATSMSNLGLERALAGHGIEVVRCGVGDRLVVEAMRREGIVLGGEQSGHIVRLDLEATGDGLLTALQTAHLVRQAGRPLSELLAGFRRFPQVLRNVPVARRTDLDSIPRLAAARQQVESALGADGRLVLRYSGTEPLARIMIEGPEQRAIEELAQQLATVIAEELGGG